MIHTRRIIALLLLMCAALFLSVGAETSQRVTWDMTEYFSDEAAFNAHVERTQKETIPAFEALVDRITDVPSARAAFEAYDALYAQVTRAVNYSEEKTNLDATDALASAQYQSASRLFQAFRLAENRQTNRLLGLGEAFWTQAMESDALKPWRRFLTKNHEKKGHQLPDEQEALLQPANLALKNIEQMFNTLIYAELETVYVQDTEGNDVKVNSANSGRAMTDKDRDYRKRFYEADQKRVFDKRNTLSQILGSFTTLNEQLARLHGYENVFESTLLKDDITPDVYAALIDGTLEHIDAIGRKNEIWRKALDVETLYSYDTGVPLIQGDAPKYTYEQAQEILKDALAPLGEDYIQILQMAFDDAWIDVYPGESKLTGAYSGGSIEIHPFVLLNFTDDADSVGTLAHELGHAAHQYLSQQTQESAFDREVTAFASEVASTTNERLVARYLIDHAQSDEEKLYHLLTELTNIEGTFFGQVAYADFERKMHRVAEEGGSFTADAIDQLYTETRDRFNPGLTYPELASSRWARVPHFYYNYYVYIYAVDAAVSCQIMQGIESGDQAMIEAYHAFLRAGNSKSAPELFAQLGVDVTDPTYIEPLIAYYNELLDQIEALLPSVNA